MHLGPSDTVGERHNHADARRVYVHRAVVLQRAVASALGTGQVFVRMTLAVRKNNRRLDLRKHLDVVDHILDDDLGRHLLGLHVRPGRRDQHFTLTRTRRPTNLMREARRAGGAGGDGGATALGVSLVRRGGMVD